MTDFIPRDRHLFGPGPKKALALDGGGTRGIVALGFLARMEALLAAEYGTSEGFRLCQHFDLIAGTSTGALIASGLALGMRVRELADIYMNLAPAAFGRRFLRVQLLAARYDHRPLEAALQRFIGERTLDSEDLQTGLIVVAKRFDTASVWIMSNSPRAPFWEDRPEEGATGNRHYSLAQLVRASAAAPTFFAPTRISVLQGSKPGTFIDGGVSPHNSPILPVLMVSQMRAYGITWPLGPEQLHIVSIGCGSFRQVSPDGSSPRTAMEIGIAGLAGLIDDGQLLALTLAQWLSEPQTPWPLNSEIGDLSGEVLGGRALFGFTHFDLRLEQDWLNSKLGLDVPPALLKQLRRIDVPGEMARLAEIAGAAADVQVTRGSLGLG